MAVSARGRDMPSRHCQFSRPWYARCVGGATARVGRSCSKSARVSSFLTRRWREPDSNHRSRSCERLFWALPIGDGGTKGGATYRFRSETTMLAWSGCPQPFPSRRDREFESVFLQRRVCCEP